MIDGQRMVARDDGEPAALGLLFQETPHGRDRGLVERGEGLIEEPQPGAAREDPAAGPRTDTGRGYPPAP